MAAMRRTTSPTTRAAATDPCASRRSCPGYRARLERARLQGVSREVRAAGGSQLGTAGAPSTLFAVSWLFVGSYPCSHGRRARHRIDGPLNKPDGPLSKPSYMSAADVRSSFLQFFRGQSHIVV